MINIKEQLVYKIKLFRIIISFLLALILIYCSENGGDKISEVVYEMHKYKIVSENCDTSSGKCASVEFNYPVFSGSKNLPAIGILNSYINTALLDEYPDSAMASIDELGRDFIKEYENFLAEFTDYSIGWALERDIKVAFKDRNTISLEFFEYSFMGGAHPNTAKTYQSFNLKTGEKIVIQDSTILNQLTKIAEKEFRRMRNIPDDKPPSNAGFWFEKDEFYLNDNFAIIDEGLIFYFNPYEIGPYALGPTEILLKGDQLGDIIKNILKN